MKSTAVFDFFRRFKTAVFSVVLMITFAFIIYFTKDIRLLVLNTTVDARFWPKVIGIAGCALSALLFIQGVIEGTALKRQEEADAAAKPERKNLLKDIGTIRTVITLGLMFLYILGLDTLGFLVMTALYLFFQFLTFSDKEDRNIGKLLLITVIFTVIVYVLFRYAFQMMLPSGKLWNGMGGLSL